MSHSSCQTFRAFIFCALWSPAFEPVGFYLAVLPVATGGKKFHAAILPIQFFNTSTAMMLPQSETNQEVVAGSRRLGNMDIWAENYKYIFSFGFVFANWSRSTSCSPLLQAMWRCIVGNLEGCSDRIFTTSLLFWPNMFPSANLHILLSSHSQHRQLFLRMRLFSSHSLALKTHLQSLKFCIEHPGDDPTLAFTGSLNGVGVQASQLASWRAAGVSQHRAETMMRSEGV